MKKRILRVASLVLILLFLLPFAVSCEGRPWAQTWLAGTEVGKIGNFSVQYEEFYYMAHKYYESYKDDYPNDPQGLKNAIWKSINEKIVSELYAIPALCEKENVSCSESELNNYASDYIAAVIASEFNGSRDEYLAQMEANGLTDHFYRKFVKQEMLYNKLVEKYKENGVIPSSNDAILKYIDDNFIHTIHIRLTVKDKAQRELVLSKMNDKLQRIKNGTNIVSLIKESDDFNTYLQNADGMYVCKESNISEEYINAAFKLNVGQLSDIVVSKTENFEECFYIIKRVSSKESEIFAQKSREAEANLTFVPNDYAKSLDVTKLEAPGNGIDYLPVHYTGIAVIVILGIILSVIGIREFRSRRFRQKHLKKQKNK